MVTNIYSALFKKSPSPAETPRQEAHPSGAETSTPTPEPLHKGFDYDAWHRETAAREALREKAALERELAARRLRKWRLGQIQYQRERIASCEDAEELSQLCRDHSGFMREAAVQRCVDLRRADLLPFIFERLNDWVPVVRDAARSGVLILLPLLSDAEALAFLPAAHALTHLKRSDHSAWIAQFERALIEKVPVALFAERIHSANVALARSSFRVLWHYGLCEPSELIRGSLERMDDILMARLSLQACASLPQDQQLPLYQAALHSHFGIVRVQALRALLKTGSEDGGRGIALDALWDEQASMRSVAIFHLRNQGFDVRAQYLATPLDSSVPPSKRRIVLAELGSVGTSDDVGLLRSFITAEQPGTRLIALAAWFRLEPSVKDQVARQALLDSSPRVRKFAAYLVSKHGAFLPADFVRETMKRHGDERPLF